MAALIAGVALLGAAPASGAPLLVTSTDDSGAGSLRQAIATANAMPDADEITFQVTGTIALSSGTLAITRNLTISGPGPDKLAITGNSMAQPIFAVGVGAGESARIEGIKIADARATAFAGGGVSMFGVGSLQLENVWLFDNFASQGGAVFADHGTTSIRNSALNNNHAQFGGAMVARRFGMGAPASVQISSSTLSDNSAMEFGGALNPAEGASITIRSSTIVGNKANDDNNTSGDGGGIYNNLSTVNIADSILAANSVGTGGGANGQCAGNALASAGYNLRSAADPNCTGFTATGDIVEPNPMLGTLGANGGPTPTIPLLTGSPAINAGNPAAVGGAFPTCPATDQRGLPRGGGAGVCDIGAFEVQPPPPPTQTPTNPPTGQSETAKTRKKCKKKRHKRAAEARKRCKRKRHPA